MRKYSLYSTLAAISMVVLPVAAHADWDDWRHEGYYHHNYHPHRHIEYIVEQPRPVYYQQPVYSAAAVDYCREFTRIIYVGGHPRHAYGNACLQPDGSWRMVD